MVAGLQQERLVTEKELEALEAAEMAWLVRSKRPLSMPNSPSKERLSGIGGEREHAQAVGREQEERERERERRSGEALHQAKCLWVGRAVDNKVCVSADWFPSLFVVHSFDGSSFFSSSLVGSSLCDTDSRRPIFVRLLNLKTPLLQ